MLRDDTNPLKAELNSRLKIQSCRYKRGRDQACFRIDEWERGRERGSERESERERARERESEGERESERESERLRARERDRERERARQTDRQTDRTDAVTSGSTFWLFLHVSVSRINGWADWNIQFSMKKVIVWGWMDRWMDGWICAQHPHIVLFLCPFVLDFRPLTSGAL